MVLYCFNVSLKQAWKEFYPLKLLKTLWIIQLTETRLQFTIQETILWRMRAAFSDLFALALTKTMESLSSGYLMDQNDSSGCP